MTARDKTTPLITKSDKEMGDEVKRDHAQELTAASERFATALRTAPVETTKTGQQDIRHVLFSDDERLLWTTTLESQWHRYLCKTIHSSTIH
jgi:hypothetical protein